MIFWVAAVFLLPVSPIWPPRRPFLPYGRPNLALLGFLFLPTTLYEKNFLLSLIHPGFSNFNVWPFVPLKLKSFVNNSHNMSILVNPLYCTVLAAYPHSFLNSAYHDAYRVLLPNRFQAKVALCVKNHALNCRVCWMCIL